MLGMRNGSETFLLFSRAIYAASEFRPMLFFLLGLAYSYFCFLFSMKCKKMFNTSVHRFPCELPHKWSMSNCANGFFSLPNRKWGMCLFFNSFTLKKDNIILFWRCFPRKPPFSYSHVNICVSGSSTQFVLILYLTADEWILLIQSEFKANDFMPVLVLLEGWTGVTGIFR